MGKIMLNIVAFLLLATIILALLKTISWIVGI